MKPQAHTEYDELYWGEVGSEQFEYLNESPFLPESEDDARWHILAGKSHTAITSASTCEYCGAEMHAAGATLNPDIEWKTSLAELKWCENCRHWLWFSLVRHPMDQKGVTWTYAVSKARSFSDDMPPQCEHELAQHFRRHPGYWHSIRSRELESFVASVYKANYADSEVIHVGQPHDGGVDVLFVDSGGTDWLIQVKRRECPDSVEGFSTIQNLAGTLLIKNKLNGIVVSTADHFSIFAERAVRTLAASKYQVRLVDRGILNRMLSILLPDQPWLALLEHDLESFQAPVSEKVAAQRTSMNHG